MQNSLLEKLKQGNEDAVDTLVRELYPKLYAYVYRRMYDPVIAKDITQETFYKFFKNINQYVDNGKLLNYLYRIAYHTIQDTYKKQEVVELKEDVYQDTTYDAHVRVMRAEKHKIIRDWIHELPPHLQEVVLLRYDENLKFKDISNILGVHVSTVKSRFKLAITMLKTKAKEEDVR